MTNNSTFSSEKPLFSQSSNDKNSVENQNLYLVVINLKKNELSPNLAHANSSVNVTNLVTNNAQTSVFSVEMLNKNIKQIVEGTLSLVWVKGEISNFKAHSSGHLYFSLKDSKSQIKAVMFRGYNSKLPFKPHDGLEVIIRGRVTVYEPRGEYQISCEMMEPVGAGALQKAFEQLKDKLKKEGLFELSKKRPLPHFPRHIAIVTSPTGAAIKDMLNILSRRNKTVRITLVPTLVQGASAAPQICEALKKAWSLPEVDAIIIGRGGGSIEDLWAFNNEELALLISKSPVPVISAVGHEIDFTIADFVADLRAPTPSAAAELVVKNSDDLLNRLKSLQRLLWSSLQRTLKLEKQKFYSLAHRLVDPKKKLQDLALKNDDLLDRLNRAWSNYFKKCQYQINVLDKRMISPLMLIKDKKQKSNYLSERLLKNMDRSISEKRTKVEKSMALLHSLSPLNVVERGYSIVMKEAHVIKSVIDVEVDDLVEIRLAQGQLKARIEQKLN
jgi:exodeoxyribonuclease VII large subunit